MRTTHAPFGVPSDGTGGPALDSAPTPRPSVAAADRVSPDRVPPVTASGSGLDPDISPEYAMIQASRVAAARNLPVQQVQTLVREHTKGPILGFIGDERVNVLRVNLALAELQPGGSDRRP